MAGDKQHILNYVKEKLDLYVKAVKSKHVSERDQIKHTDFLDFENEKILLNKYIHWSATDKTGHSPRPNHKRVIKDA